MRSPAGRRARGQHRPWVTTSPGIPDHGTRWPTQPGRGTRSEDVRATCSSRSVPPADGSSTRRELDGDAGATRCASRTAVGRSHSPRATSPAAGMSRRRPPGWRSLAGATSRPRSRSPGGARARGPSRATWPSSRWASAGVRSSTTSATSTSSSSRSRPTGGDEPDGAAPRRPGSRRRCMRVCSAHTEEGAIWPVDAEPAPGGHARARWCGRSPSYLAYYDRWASTWEFQALLKARPVAGDLALGRRFRRRHRAARVVGAAARPHFVEDVQAMRRRVEEHVPARDADRQLKLGPRRAARRRVRRPAAAARARPHRRLRSAAPRRSPRSSSCRRGGYVGRDDAAELDRAYRFLRSMEHRLQLHRLRRTHVVPDDEADLRRLGRSLGFRERPGRGADARVACAPREVRRLHEKLFYRPLLNAVARLPGGRGPADPGGRRGPARGPRLRRPGAARCGTSRP